PVAYAETASVWLKHPEVAKSVDVLLVHLYPYWDGLPIDQAIPALVSRFQELRKVFPGKRIVIGETGWPSRGEIREAAVPSQANQARYLKEFLAASGAADLDYFYFSLFSESWKTVQEGLRGAHWGLFSESGQPHPDIAGILGGRAARGFSRAPGKPPLVTPLKVPAFVYRDGESDHNRFRPTNWMGETGTLKIDEFCRIHPRSGEHCLKIVFTPGSVVSWTGIYWVGPAFNHWGQFPGYELKGAKQLVFWARGEKGGETVEFKTGGMDSAGLPYRDSFGPVSLGQPAILTREWKRYVIDLRGQNTSSLLGGFCFALNALGNRGETVFFLDHIVLAGDDVPGP
ncbi:MAG: glycosyl hydrolase family 17 protein, partial [Verrucomicrobiales bacterium]